MIGLGVIGYGYWGPNVVRNFESLELSEVVGICDQNPQALERARLPYPRIPQYTNAAELIAAKGVDVVAVVTPVWTHFEVTKQALAAGKHVFVEKPFTSTSDQAEELIELAEKKHLKIMVDHTFLFTGAVRKIRQLIEEDVLGSLYYYDSTRVNLGLFQHDINVIWDLAPHDLSIMDYLIGLKAQALVATGAIHVNGHEDMAYVTVYFPENIIGHINVNWLSPVKVRTTLLGGEKKMLVWNDVEADEKLKVYDRGVHLNNGNGIYELLVSYRSGDMWAPKVEQTEALRFEATHFLDCITNDKTPLCDGIAGLRVVKMLEAADKSLKAQGRLVQLS